VSERLPIYNAKVALTVKITESLRRELKIVSAMEGKTLSQIVTALINDYLRSRKKKRET
jgi:hypothetical protein